MSALPACSAPFPEHGLGAGHWACDQRLAQGQPPNSIIQPTLRPRRPSLPLPPSGDVARAEDALSRGLRDHITVERNTVWRDMAAMERKYAAVSVKQGAGAAAGRPRWGGGGEGVGVR